MKKFSLYILTLAIVSVAFVFLGMKPCTNLGYTLVNFSNFVGKDSLKLDSIHYKNELGQDFTISNFKYYVGNFKLYSSSGKIYSLNKYFLVNEFESKSKEFALTVIPDGDYTTLSFTLGVDSANNCSGAQSGALDPVNAMFWSWNQGYIFLKLEGKSAASKSTGNQFEYHIGGYRSPNNCIRTITIDLKNSPLKIRFEKSSVLYLKADASEILKTPTTIDFSKLSSVTDFHNATTIANNYQDMFSLLKVENEK